MCRNGVDAMSGVNGEVVFPSPKACLTAVCIEPVVNDVVNIVIRMAPIHKIHAYRLGACCATIGWHI